MKIILILTFSLIALTSCTRDCEQEAKDLDKTYLEAIQHTNGNPDALRDIKRQYEAAKANLDC